MDIASGILIGPAGALLGLRHAFESDHIAALSALSAGKLSKKRACFVGVAWGTGHCFALFAVAFLLLAFSGSLNPQIQIMLDFFVGISLLWCAWRAGREILFPVIITNCHSTINLRTPFFIGILHGLVGSGALFVIAATRTEGWILTGVLLTCFSIALVIATASISLGFSVSKRFSVFLCRAACTLSVLLNSYLGLKLLSKISL